MRKGCFNEPQINGMIKALRRGCRRLGFAGCGLPGLAAPGMW